MMKPISNTLKNWLVSFGVKLLGECTLDPLVFAFESLGWRVLFRNRANLALRSGEDIRRFFWEG